VVTLQESTKKLREAESLVAQLTGELRAIEAQEKEYATKLAELGLTPDQVPAALEALQVEESRLQTEIAELTNALAGVLG
jgi:septal ring factor EnvC (AmiA/AmiB activator)